MTVKLLLTCNLNTRKAMSGKLMLKTWGKISNLLTFQLRSTFLYAGSRLFFFLILSFHCHCNLNVYTNNSEVGYTSVK